MKSTIRRAAILSFAAAPLLCLATETHVWEQADQSEFTRGTLQRLSVRSDGKLTVAPELKEIDSTTTPYLWAVARGSKGNVYYAGGAPTGASTNIYVLSPGGKPKVFGQCTGLEIHALAVDAKDRVYAAVLPDAKVYRFDKSGKPEVFFDPHQKYIWAMEFDRSGDLFLATGDAGLIFKVAPDGTGKLFADTKESHARSMAIDAEGNLIVGTEPGGLVMRISPEGKTFVLFQTRKREVTSIAIHDGSIYAASVGTKAPVVTGTPPVLPQAPTPVSPAGTQHVPTAPPQAAPPVGSLNVMTQGGSDVYRIHSDGAADRIWESSSDIAYAIAFDPSGAPLIGTGNKGTIYRVDSEQRSTVLLNIPPTQITGLLQGPAGLVYAITGNVGNLYAIGPRLEKTGTIESEVFDAGDFSYWGKIHTTATLNGGKIAIEARSGNLNNPQHDWSEWSSVAPDPLGGRVNAPPARFFQYRIVLTVSADGRSPELSVVDVPYLPKNVAPRVEAVEIAPMNYKQSQSNNALERSVAPSGSALSISVPAVGQHRSGIGGGESNSSGGATLQYSKGAVTVRWAAIDANHDPLSYKVEIRGKSDTVWRVLKDDLLDAHWSFDGQSFPDGEYIVRVTASDAAGNPPGNALTGSLESDSFTIDNTPPAIVGIKAEGGRVTFTAKDALSWIDKAEYAVNGGEWQLLQPADKVTDSQVLSYSVTAASGQLVAIRIFDEDDNEAVATINMP